MWPAARTGLQVVRPRFKVIPALKPKPKWHYRESIKRVPSYDLSKLSDNFFFSGKMSPLSSCFCFLWEIFGALSKSTDGWPARRQGWVSELSICKPSVCQAVSPGEGTAGVCLDWIEGLMRTAACLELVGSGNNCPRRAGERMTLIASASLPVLSNAAHTTFLCLTPPHHPRALNWVSSILHPQPPCCLSFGVNDLLFWKKN